MVVVVEPDPDPDATYLDQRELADRRAAYRRGEFALLRVRAEAEVLIEGTMQTLTSPGLSGLSPTWTSRTSRRWWARSGPPSATC